MITRIAAAEVFERYLPRFMAGLMQRDFSKALSALRSAATDYHLENHFDRIGFPQVVIDQTILRGEDIPEDAQLLLSAAIWIWKAEGKA